VNERLAEVFVVYFRKWRARISLQKSSRQTWGSNACDLMDLATAPDLLNFSRLTGKGSLRDTASAPDF